jgi:hypothetical protein
MLHTCVERFHVIGERGNILSWDGKRTRPRSASGKAVEISSRSAELNACDLADPFPLALCLLCFTEHATKRPARLILVVVADTTNASKHTRKR